MIRRTLGLLACLAGAALVLVDARWVAGDPPRFACTWAGRVLWEGGRVELAARIVEREPLAYGTAALAAALALVAGRLVAARAGASGAARAGTAAWFALLLAPALLPAVARFVAERGPDSAERYLDPGDLARGLGWGLVALGALAVLGARGARRPAERAEPAPGARTGTRTSVLLACVVAAALPALVSRSALGGAPLTNDGAAYAFQAEVFAGGRLAREVGELAPFFPARQVVPGPRAFSKYPPGHSALLAVGALVGVPELVPRTLSALVPLLVWLLARRLGARRPAWAAWAVALSPAVLGVQSLWLSHATSVPLALGFALAAVAAWDAASRGEAARARRLALVAGILISVAFTARPLTALAFGAPFAVRWLVPFERRRASLALVALIGAAPAVALFLSVNHALTGSAWHTAYGLYADLVSPNDRWGVVNLPTALPHTGYNLARALVWTHGLVPGLWLAAAGAAGPRRPREVHLLWTPAVALLAAHALHRFHGIPWTGPVYLVEAVPLLCILSASGLALLEEHAGPAAVAVVVAAAVVGSGWLLGEHMALAREESLARRAPRIAAERAGVTRGVVFVPLETETARRRHPLPPPARTDRGVVFAADLGARNARLLERLGDPPAWRWSPESGALVPLDRAGDDPGDDDSR